MLQIALLMTSSLAGPGGEYQRICDDIFFHPPTSAITFSKTETQLICGDPTNQAWSKIPKNQAKHFIKSFLQTRGYFQPEFQDRDGTLIVNPGAQAAIESITMTPKPTDSLQHNVRLRVRDKTLTPKLLDETENWLKTYYQEHGFPCPQLQLRANPVQSTLHIDLLPGDKMSIAAITTEPVEDILPEALKRFHAIDQGQPYSLRSEVLSNRRTMASGMVASSFFATKCKKDGVSMHQYASVGPPMSVSVGFGANTEELALARFAIKHARVDPLGSSAELVAQASRRNVDLILNYRWFFDRELPRYYLQPEIVFAYKNIRSEHGWTVTLKGKLGWDWDDGRHRYTVALGPSYHMSRLFAGTGPRQARHMSWDMGLLLTDYDLEYFQASPRQGYQLQFSTTSAVKGWTSKFGAVRTHLAGEWLHNYRNLDPPSWVLGARWGWTSTLLSPTSSPEQLPPTYRHFLGGSDTLRGFAQEEIPNSDSGALHVLFLGLESRFGLPGYPKIQPFIFNDVGSYFLQNLGENGSYFYSPGTGIRWESPFAPIRMTIAKGFIGELARDQQPIPSHWQFYASIGEEF